ncbi:hypothetical protein BDV27DRAFT_127221, partial [Aspergillus caelatus]
MHWWLGWDGVVVIYLYILWLHGLNFRTRVVVFIFIIIILFYDPVVYRKKGRERERDLPSLTRDCPVKGIIIIIILLL